MGGERTTTRRRKISGPMISRWRRLCAVVSGRASAHLTTIRSLGSVLVISPVLSCWWRSRVVVMATSAIGSVRLRTVVAITASSDGTPIASGWHIAQHPKRSGSLRFLIIRHLCTAGFTGSRSRRKVRVRVVPGPLVVEAHAKFRVTGKHDAELVAPRVDIATVERSLGGLRLVDRFHLDKRFEFFVFPERHNLLHIAEFLEHLLQHIDGDIVLNLGDRDHEDRIGLTRTTTSATTAGCVVVLSSSQPSMTYSSETTLH